MSFTVDQYLVRFYAVFNKSEYMFFASHRQSPFWVTYFLPLEILMKSIKFIAQSFCLSPTNFMYNFRPTDITCICEINQNISAADRFTYQMCPKLQFKQMLRDSSQIRNICIFPLSHIFTARNEVGASLCFYRRL